MTMPAFPQAGYPRAGHPEDPPWTTWAQAVHDAATEVVEGRLTEAAQRAAFVTRGVPSGITPTPTGLWDATRSLYGGTPTALRRIRGKLAAAKAGKATVKILAVGDSLTAGEGAGAPQNQVAYPAAFRDALVAAGFPLAGEGWVQPNCYAQTSATKPTQWTSAGAWVAVSGFEYQSNMVGSPDVGDTLTFTSTKPGDTLEFTYLHNNKGFSYSVDGGAAVPRPFVAPSPITYDTVTVTGLNPANTHSVTFTVTEATAGTVHIGPARVYNSTSGGVLVANAGVGGSRSSDWRTDASPDFLIGPTAFALNADIDLLLLEPMIVNDVNASITPATHKANIKAIANSYIGLASKPNVILVLPGYTSGISQATLDSYRAVNYQIADELGIPLVDMAERFGTYTGANADGYYADGTHLTVAGYGDMGRAVAGSLL